MSASGTLQRGSTRRSEGDDVGAPPTQGPAKRTRSDGEGPGGGTAAQFDEDVGDEDSDELGGSATDGAPSRGGDWAMSSDLLAAMGLGGPGDFDEDAREGQAGPAGAGPVRRKAAAAAWANDGRGEADIARAGFVDAPAASFPHREAIERSFGTSLPATAHVGEAAGRASAALGADGFALGDQVGFASPTPSLELAAHEAAHVMQATSGVQLHGGEGAYEDHADAVAQRVVRGESAVDLLAAGPAAAPAVRRGKEHGRGSSGKGRSKGKRQGKQPATHQREPKGGKRAASSQKIAKSLARELAKLIRKAEWQEIRKTAYPKESKPGLKRAQQRRDGELPELSGLGKIVAIDRFATEFKRIQGDWATLSTQERLGEITDAINHELRIAGVPDLLEVTTVSASYQGAFIASTWEMEFRQATITGSTLPDADASELCNTALHEARHAEQAFLAARFAAGPPRNMEAAEIADVQGIPGVIATAAFNAQFTRDTDGAVAALGKQMYQANVTDGPRNQQISDDDYLAEMKDAREEAEEARNDLLDTPNDSTIATATTRRDQLKAAIAEVERRYTLYRNIPYEADAHDVGDAAGLAFDAL
jgi:Domain of unknown function (DUF4157)